MEKHTSSELQNNYQTTKSGKIYERVQKEYLNFINELNSKQINWLKAVFHTVIGSRLLHEGYVDVSPFLDYPVAKQAYAMEWKKKGSCVWQLYRLRGAGIDNSPINVFNEFWEEYTAVKSGLSKKELESVVYWFFTKYSSGIKSRRALLVAMTEHCCPENEKQQWALDGNILSNCGYCKIIRVSTLEEYVNVAARFQTECEDRKIYYRGHSNVNYDLLPGVKRVENWYRNEDRMYHELLVRCPNDFRECTSHLDYLVEMQHYGLPTRLLDITESPMVALYFACCNDVQRAGEVIMFPVEQHSVKYFHSDTVAILAALSTRTWEYREELRQSVEAGDKKRADKLLQQLAREIKSKNPAFEPEIHMEDVQRNLFVSPVKSNQRIVKQEGAFIICGLSAEGSDMNSLQSMRMREYESEAETDKKGRTIVCVIENKKNILQQLDQFGINQAALFPEIDQVTGYIKGQYLQTSGLRDNITIYSKT